MFGKRVVRMLGAQSTAGAFTTVDPAEASASDRARARATLNSRVSAERDRGLGE